MKLKKKSSERRVVGKETDKKNTSLEKEHESDLIKEIYELLDEIKFHKEQLKKKGFL